MTRNRSVHALFSEAAAAHPERQAVVAGDDCLTFAELNARTRALAADLVHRGLPRQSVVGLLLPRGLDLVVALLAVLRAGCAYLPLAPQLPSQRLAYMVREAGVQWVLTGPGEARPDCPTTFVDVTAGTSAEDGVSDVSVHADELAYVMYTSGSTGHPKAVEVTHGNVLSLIAGLTATAWQGAGPARVAWNASASFDASVQQWTRLCRGDTLVLVDEEQRTDPDAFAAYLAAQGVTDLDIVPSHLRSLLLALPTPMRLLVGGEPIPPDLWARLHELDVQAWNVYGVTECTVDSVAAGIGAGLPRLGEPLPGVRVYVLDDQLRPVPDGGTGELFIAGGGVSRGYRGLPGRTAAAFLPDTVAGDGGRMYRTGDLVRRSAGELQFLGRRDRQVKVRGHRIELDEIETVLAALPGVERAGVTLRTDLPGGTGIAAYVQGVGATGDLLDRLAQMLPEYMLPSAVVTVPVWPLLPSGKTDYTALPAPDAAPVASEPLAHGAEQTMARIWSAVLGQDVRGADADFFELGGDSLKVARVLNKCREAFQVRLRPRALFDNRVLRDFTKVVLHAVDER